MSKTINISKGLNIQLKGEAEKSDPIGIKSKYCAVKPTDFPYIFPKLLVNPGDQVKAGTPLFYDKYNERVVFTAPVSGTVADVIRGPKRVIEEIKIKAGEHMDYVAFDKADPNQLNREQIIELLLKSGLWPLIRQRPYNCIADPGTEPKAIFISAFDSSPLAPDTDYIVHGHGDVFQTGLDAVKKLTAGTTHLTVNADQTCSKVFTNSKGVQINSISGPHPAGNVGVQIHHIDPINKGEIVWYLYPQDVIAIGKLFREGKYEITRTIALTGSDVKSPRYYKAVAGTSIHDMVDQNVSDGELRFISGNILTGKKIYADGYLGFYDTQVTVIPEVSEPDFFGWALPGFGKYSVSRTFTAWLCGKRKYTINTNYNGMPRAFVVNGQYEKVFPMDILPVQLLKSIIIKDIDQMEQLGIYEVSEEDFALCEFVCTSKIECQSIVREGLDMIRNEFS